MDLEDEGVVEDGVLAGGVLGRALEDEGAGEAGWVTEAPPDLALPKEALDWTGALIPERAAEGAENGLANGCAGAVCRELLCGGVTLCCPPNCDCRVDVPEPIGVLVTVEPKGEVVAVVLPFSCRVFDDDGDGSTLPCGCGVNPCCETKPWGEATPTGRVLRVDLTGWTV